MFTNPLNGWRATSTQRSPRRVAAHSALAMAALLVACSVPRTLGAERDVSVSSAQRVPGAWDEPLVGVTTPVARATLAAVMPARVAEILADEGVAVAAGDVVIELDDAVQRAKTAIAKAAADSMIGVELAKAEWDRARSEVVRLERLRDDASASVKELADARGLAMRRRLEYELAGFTHEQAIRAYDREQALLDEHFIRAPFSGRVIEHLKHPGETVNPFEGIATMVKLDPLLVTVNCPLERVGTIAVGLPTTLTPIGFSRAPRIGRVTQVSRVADAGSQTFRVKIEVQNDDAAWIAGMKVAVRFVAPDRARVERTTRRPGDSMAPYAAGHSSTGVER